MATGRNRKTSRKKNASGDSGCGVERPASAVRRPAVGIAAAYAAAFAYALVSLYWAMGGQGLICTVGGFAEHAARQGAGAAVLLGAAGATVKMLGGVLALAKMLGGVLALALVRP